MQNLRAAFQSLRKAVFFSCEGSVPVSGFIAKTVTLTKLASGMMTPVAAVYLLGGAAGLYLAIKGARSYLGAEETPVEEIDLLPFHPEEGRWKIHLTRPAE